MSKWKCYVCGDAENCDISCTLETPTPDKPEFCPATGEETDWIEQKHTKDSETTPEQTPC